MTDSCCGHPAAQRRQARPAKRVRDLPPNPVVPGGMPLVYLGLADIDLNGTASGLTYHVGGPQRRFVADPRDVPALLAGGDFVITPGPD